MNPIPKDRLRGIARLHTDSEHYGDVPLKFVVKSANDGRALYRFLLLSNPIGNEVTAYHYARQDFSIMLYGERSRGWAMSNGYNYT